MSDQPQTTLRDALTSAVEAHEASAEITTPEASQVETVETGNRDEKGRFTAKQAEPQQTMVEQAQEQPVVKPRPSSWKKDYEEHWSKLDPTLQDYINQRESDYAKGVSQYKQNYEAVAPIYEAMQPFMPLLQQHNMQPQQWISNLGNAHKMLVTGSPEEKLQIFARLATDYGVPLQALTGQQYDPQQSQFMSEFNQLKQKLTAFEQAQEEKEFSYVNNVIDKFSKDKPYFEDVVDDVLGLLQSGIIKGATPEERLQLAYDKAIRLNDDVWQKQQAEAQQAQAQANVQAQAQKAAEAKAKAVSTRSNSPTAVMTSDNSKDRRSILAEAVETHLGGRV